MKGRQQISFSLRPPKYRKGKNSVVSLPFQTNEGANNIFFSSLIFIWPWISDRERNDEAVSQSDGKFDMISAAFHAFTSFSPFPCLIFRAPGIKQALNKSIIDL